MLLNIGERIRELRRERALTQDDVARRMNVSAQAVSKWENSVSYPDLELIPPLAELLGVTIDGLFRADTGNETDDYCRMADELLRDSARARDGLPLLREAVIRHPCHAGLLRRLGQALYISYVFPENAGEVITDENGDETVITHGDPMLMREAVAVFERALDCTKESGEREPVVNDLTTVYALTGQREKAIQLALQQNRLSCSREIMLVRAEEGTKKDEAVANALFALMIQTAVTLLCAVPGADGVLNDADDEVRLIHAGRCVSTAKFIESFFPDGRCGRLHFFIAQLYYYPAALYAALNEFEKADECYIPMLRHELANREYGTGGAYSYTGPLFDKITDAAPEYVKYEPSKQPFTEEYKTHLMEKPELIQCIISRGSEG